MIELVRKIYAILNIVYRICIRNRAIVEFVTSRERMLVAMKNGTPDRVPVAPDMSNMIPCRLTGKPFWDIYLFNDPPLWQAYMDAVDYFKTDGWLYSLEDFSLQGEDGYDVDSDSHKNRAIVERSPERIVVREFAIDGSGIRRWSTRVTVYPRRNPPSTLAASKIGMAEPPQSWQPVDGVKSQPMGYDLLEAAHKRFAGRGVIGLGAYPAQLGNPANPGFSIYDYQDHPTEVRRWAEGENESIVKRLRKILQGPVLPDFVLTGGSGMLIFNTPEILRELALPGLKEITGVCRRANVPSQIHCCGPERALVAMCAEETELSSINPLEIPPMGDCDLADIKRSFGSKLGLMGNLHTTDVMLSEDVGVVRLAALEAIRDAGKDGGFILSTGDQCGRDTPDENIRALVEVAEEFGRYPLDFDAIEREIETISRN